MSEFKKEEKKRGFWAPLLNLLGRGGTSAAGGITGMGGSGAGLGGLSGLFATKAGIMGMVLGAATIAAGVGVVYNFIGPSAKPAYGPQLFQDTYYAEQANNAGIERARQKESAASEPSTLALFSEQAKKEGLGMGGEGAPAGDKGAASPEAAAEPDPVQADANNSAASAASADTSAGAPGGAGKLQASSGFGGKGGGIGASAASPKLSIGGGLSDGINAKFAPVYRPPAGQGQGKTAGMKGSLAAMVKGSSKYTLPSNKKGAYGQAKYAGKVGAKAAYTSDAAGARTIAEQAFSGETAGSGDVGAGEGGLGLGGAGLSGNDLKGSDPSLNQSVYTPPTPDAPENVSPWQKMTDMAMYGMLAGAILLVIANKLTSRAKQLAANPMTLPQAMGLYKAAMAFAGMAMAAAGVVIYAGVMMMQKYGQKWTGIAYMLAGASLIMKAYQAITTAKDGMKSGSAVSTEVQSSGLDGATSALGSLNTGNTTINKDPTEEEN